jgi:hypothetical protein
MLAPASTPRPLSPLRTASLVLAFLGLPACGTENYGIEPTGAGPLYAMMYEIYGPDEESNSYFTLVDSVEAGALDPADGIEFAGGRAFLQTYGGWIFVGHPTEPRVTRYSLSASGALVEPLDLGFGNYGLTAGYLDDWNATFISESKAYLFDFAQGVTVVWNPTTMEIEGEILPPDELLREGYSLDGSPAMVRGNRLFRTFFWVNYDEAEYSPDLLLGVYDVETDELVELVPETRCPAPGNIVHRDEADNIYFSNWLWPVAGTLMYDAPKSCVLRLNAGDEHFDSEWALEYSSVAEGREGAMFSYLGDNQALFAAFHDERTSFDAETDPWEYVGSNNWRIWKLDLETNAAAPLEGLDFNGGAFTPVRFDDRPYILVPDATAWDSTQFYAIDGEVATPSLEVPGWTYQFKRVR